jgi:hypothetical protein
MDGSRRSGSSDIDDHFSMPSTAGSFGLASPYDPAHSRSSSSRSQKPMFGYEASRTLASPYSVHAPSRPGSLDPLHGLNVLGSTMSTNGFRQLSSETYPSLTPYTPGYSSDTGALGSRPSLQGGSYMSGMPSTLVGHPGLSTRRGGLPPAPSYAGSSQGSISAYPPASPSSRDPLGRGEGRRLSRNASYAGLSSFEASGW